jgi:hypothetical protein
VDPDCGDQSYNLLVDELQMGGACSDQPFKFFQIFFDDRQDPVDVFLEGQARFTKAPRDPKA